jgi:membrane-bound lytic murein transglycosylase D
VSNAIKRNLKKNRQTDFWSLDLPKETRAYVPKLIALSKIVKDPEAYNIQFPFIADAPYFEKVEIGGQIDLAQAADLAEVDISEIYQLNPGFNQWASSPLGPHHLLIPISQAPLFRENIKSLPPEKRLNWHRYTVKPGDSLIKIAKEFHTTPMLIKEINHLKSNMIRARQKLLIPIASKDTLYYDLSENNRLQKRQDSIGAKKGTEKLSYRVKPGDTIWDLAREHKVGVRELARWNGLAPTDPIFPGQNLVIWSNKPRLTAVQNINTSAYQKREMIQKVGYYVRKGDSLAKIANKFSVTIKDLIAWNNLDVKKYIKPGQKLTIYVDITNT